MVADLLQVPVLDRADADYVKEISGYSVGGVAPLGWMNEPSITLIDEALRDYQVIWAAAGHPHAVFPSTYQELLKASGAKAARVGN
jgi:prolyl-tRNA editing enzyme YbaK/EbsC (Cys-tRNA(Pro) deacylase)